MIEFNGGLVPVLETQTGQMIKESQVIACFANEYSHDGYELIPKNPFEAA
jgi:glutathione S-transferase